MSILHYINLCINSNMYLQPSPKARQHLWCQQCQRSPVKASTHESWEMSPWGVVLSCFFRKHRQVRINQASSTQCQRKSTHLTATIGRLFFVFLCQIPRESLGRIWPWHHYWWANREGSGFSHLGGPPSTVLLPVRMCAFCRVLFAHIFMFAVVVFFRASYLISTATPCV